MVQTLLRIVRLAFRKLYLVIICPNAHEKLTKGVIRSSWSQLKHWWKSLVQPIGSPIWALFSQFTGQDDQKWNWVTSLAYRKPYLVIIWPQFGFTCNCSYLAHNMLFIPIFRLIYLYSQYLALLRYIFSYVALFTTFNPQLPWFDHLSHINPA